MAKRVTTIPATINTFTSQPVSSRKKRKVAGYARVSTDHEDQANSYEAQVDYYTNYIKSRDDWEFVGMYSDEGISGTNTKHREGFNSMVADALAGRIDLIITKSVSRFARNTVDSLTTIRKLKEHNIECYFEKEQIWTFDGKGELLITIMSSLAQEESRSISENVTWGQRKRMADGKVAVPFKHFLGYDRGTHGELVVNEEQAEIVKLIYKLFLQGFTPHAIAKQLTEMGIPTPQQKKIWNQCTVKSILTNEKYKGDALMQKHYTADFLTKKLVVNNGALPQYYVEGDHDAIIPPETFELVQQEMQRRHKRASRYSGVDIFSSRLVCGECGSCYGAKVWHSNSKYRRVIYQCNHKYHDKKPCGTPYFTDEEIKEMFVAALNKMISCKDEVIVNLNLMNTTISDTTDIESDLRECQDTIEQLAGQLQMAISENARIAQDQKEYRAHFDALSNQYESAKQKHDELQYALSEKVSMQAARRQFIQTLKEQSSLTTEFDASAWGILLDHMTIYSKDDIRFTFKDGTEIKV